MADKNPLLMFPLAIMIVMALLGIFVGGLSGGNVTVQTVGNTNLGSTGHYTNDPIVNGAINGMEPLGGGIINTTTGQPDHSNPTTTSRLSDFTLIAIILGGALLAVIAFTTVAGVNILGSGVNAGVSAILFGYGAWAAIWLVMTAASQSIFFGDTPFGLGLIFYAVLTMTYLIGTVTHVQGASA